jgi:GNAT superfamily N-acetyltransferase
LLDPIRSEASLRRAGLRARRATAGAQVGMIVIRAARPEEAALLSELALRSKATWGYTDAFMQRCESVLRVTEDYIREQAVFVAESNGAVAGFYSLNPLRYEIELDLLFVAPEAFGQGTGRALLSHAFGVALELGYSELFVESDPGAEPFYTRLGGVRIGTVASTVEADRELPVLKFRLPCRAAASLSTPEEGGFHAGRD